VGPNPALLALSSLHHPGYCSPVAYRSPYYSQVYKFGSFRRVSMPPAEHFPIEKNPSADKVVKRASMPHSYLTDQELRVVVSEPSDSSNSNSISSPGGQKRNGDLLPSTQRLSFRSSNASVRASTPESLPGAIADESPEVTAIGWDQSRPASEVRSFGTADLSILISREDLVSSREALEKSAELVGEAAGFEEKSHGSKPPKKGIRKLFSGVTKLIRRFSRSRLSESQN